MRNNSVTRLTTPPGSSLASDRTGQPTADGPGNLLPPAGSAGSARSRLVRGGLLLLVLLGLAHPLPADTGGTASSPDQAWQAARLLEKQGQYDQAIQHCERALAGPELAPAERAQMEYHLAELYYNLGRANPDYPKTIRLLENIVSGNKPTSAIVLRSHLKLAEIHKRRDGTDRAGFNAEANKHYEAVLAVQGKIDASPERLDPREVRAVREAIRSARRSLERQQLLASRWQDYWGQVAKDYEPSTEHLAPVLTDQGGDTGRGRPRADNAVVATAPARVGDRKAAPGGIPLRSVPQANAKAFRAAMFTWAGSGAAAVLLALASVWLRRRRQVHASADQGCSHG